MGVLERGVEERVLAGVFVVDVVVDVGVGVVVVVEEAEVEWGGTWKMRLVHDA